MAFIFRLPAAFGTLHKAYFSPPTLAKISIFFETYYLVTKQYCHSFLKSSFEFIATKTSGIARHVAIKNKLLHLAQASGISNSQVQEFLHTYEGPAYTCNVLDMALL